MHKALSNQFQLGMQGATSARSIKPWVILTAVALGTLSGASFALDAAPAASDQGNALQEVVVTARRQNENLEKVPVSVVAISTEQLAEQRITSESDLQSATPGLTVRAATSSNQLAFAIRGQALDAFSYTSPTVLTYFNEFQTGGVASSAIYDLQSVQVLKGPQGTLFGRNATGGAVLYTTTVPGKEFTGYFNISAGNYRDKKFEGAVTIPLADWASFRVAADVEKRDGYEDNVYLNLKEGSLDTKNVRGTLLLTPTDALQNTTTFQYGKQGGYSGGLKITSVNTTCPPSPSCAAAGLYPPGFAPAAGYNPAKLASYNGILNLVKLQGTQPFWNIYNDSTAGYRAQEREIVNKTTFAINDDLTIKNIAGYNKVLSSQQADTEGSPFELLSIGLTGGPGSEGYHFNTKQYSEELQLAGSAWDKRLTYILGGYYSRDFEAVDIPLNVGCNSIASGSGPPGGLFGPPNPPGCDVPGGFRYNFVSDEKSRAVFGQANYEIFDNFKATAGYRETWEDIDFNYVNDGSLPLDQHESVYKTPRPPVLSDRKPSWTLGLDYQITPTTLVYLAQRGGFRVGGFNGTSIVSTAGGGTAINSFKPEIARDLELGIKFSGHIGDFPVRVNADVYEERVRNAQRVVYAGIASFTVNANKVQVDGFEIDALTELTSWLQVGFNYDHTNARYTDGTTNFTQVDAVTGAVVPRSVILGPYADTPKDSGSIYVRVAAPLPNDLGQVVVRTDAYFQTYFYYTNLAGSVNVPPNGVGALDPNTKIGGYALFNGRVEWNDISGSNVHVLAYIKNMFNKEYAVGGLGLGAVVGTDAVILGTPRMFGIEVGYKFGGAGSHAAY